MDVTVDLEDGHVAITVQLQVPEPDEVNDDEVVYVEETQFSDLDVVVTVPELFFKIHSLFVVYVGHEPSLEALVVQHL